MINIDSLTLKAFVKESFDFFQDAKVQKIQQPTRKELVLTLRNHSQTRKLYINIDAQLYHLCFMSRENEELRHLKKPKTPPMFCMLLRKHLEGARILQVVHVEYERIIEIYFENFNEFAQKTPYCLCVELMGKHSNVVLYNYETKVIIGCAHNIGAEKSKDRLMLGGIAYTYPPKQHKADIFETSFESFFETVKKSNEKLHLIINANYFYLTKFHSQRICQKSVENYDTQSVFSKKDIEFVYKNLREYVDISNLSCCCDKDFSVFSLKNEDSFGLKFESVNELADSFYSHNSQTRLVEGLRASIVRSLNKELKKYSLLLKKRESTTNKIDKALLYKQKADLIMANLYNIDKTSASAILEDFDSGEKIIVELDNTKSLTDNANKYYKLYNKAKTASGIEENFAAEAREKTNLLTEQLYYSQIAASYDEMMQLVQQENSLDEKLKKKPQKLQVTVESREINGFTVYIGKNNKQNDFIFSKLSSGEDIWLHALNVPGAHILIKTGKARNIDDDTLFQAAELAKEFSSAKNSSKTPVIYTKRKYVKKPPCAAPGFVTFKNEKEILV